MTKPLNPDPITVSVDEVDRPWDQAALSDQEAAGGSTPTPDQDVVDEVGKAVGVTYQEGEPLRVGTKEEDRDKHRWELDPASAEDYAERWHEQIEAEPLMKMQHQHHVKRPS